MSSIEEKGEAGLHESILKKRVVRLIILPNMAYKEVFDDGSESEPKLSVLAPNEVNNREFESFVVTKAHEISELDPSRPPVEIEHEQAPQ